jgi:hypothetical protein
MAINTMHGFNKREPIFKVGDRVKLQGVFVEKVMEHKKVFQLYVDRGAPRNWIVSLCQQMPMRVNSIEQDHNNDYVLELGTDPRNTVWQQEWFELVSHDNFASEEDLFNV